MKKSELFTQEMLETFTCHSYSAAKERAYNYCTKLCEHFNGWGFQIVAHKCQNFSVQFEFENPLNGCIMLAYITSLYKHLYFV